jgi:hypothetical protein
MLAASLTPHKTGNWRSGCDAISLLDSHGGFPKLYKCLPSNAAVLLSFSPGFLQLLVLLFLMFHSSSSRSNSKNLNTPNCMPMRLEEICPRFRIPWIRCGPGLESKESNEVALKRFPMYKKRELNLLFVSPQASSLRSCINATPIVVQGQIQFYADHCHANSYTAGALVCRQLGRWNSQSVSVSEEEHAFGLASCALGRLNPLAITCRCPHALDEAN